MFVEPTITRAPSGLHYITLHYIPSFHTPITPTVTNGASTKSFKFSECELKKMSFQKFFESISVCEFLEIGRKGIPCFRSGERETTLAELFNRGSSYWKLLEDLSLSRPGRSATDVVMSDRYAGLRPTRTRCVSTQSL